MEAGRCREGREKRRQNHGGFSLVEMMIAMALGSVVTLGVVQLYTTNARSYALLQGQSRLQESARFAFAVIGRSIREAGYRGCFFDPEALHMPDDGLPYEFDIRTGIVGYDGNPDGRWNPPLTPLPGTRDGVDTNVWAPDDLRVRGRDYRGARRGIDRGRLLWGSDLLTLRHLSGVDRSITTPVSTPAEPVTLASSQPPDAFAFDRGHFAMLHDCEKARVLRITGLTESGGITTLDHPRDDTDGRSHGASQLAMADSFGTDAAVSAIESHTYFLAPSIGLGARGSRTLSLWRKSGIEYPVELVEGIEDLQLGYGIDSDQDLVPDRYVDASSVVDWRQVRRVQVTLVVSSVDDAGLTTDAGMVHACGEALNADGDTRLCYPGENYDGQLRRSFTRTFTLRNRG